MVPKVNFRDDMFGWVKIKWIIGDLWPSILSIIMASAILLNKMQILMWAQNNIFYNHYMNHQGAYGFWYWCSILSLWFPLLWLYLRPQWLKNTKYKNAVVYSAIALALIALFLMFKMDSVL